MGNDARLQIVRAKGGIRCPEHDFKRLPGFTVGQRERVYGKPLGVLNYQDSPRASCVLRGLRVSTVLARFATERAGLRARNFVDDTFRYRRSKADLRSPIPGGARRPAPAARRPPPGARLSAIRPLGRSSPERRLVATIDLELVESRQP